MIVSSSASSSPLARALEGAFKAPPAAARAPRRACDSCNLEPARHAHLAPVGDRLGLFWLGEQCYTALHAPAAPDADASADPRP